MSPMPSSPQTAKVIRLKPQQFIHVLDNKLTNLEIEKAERMATISTE
jgi:hypothetical protein